MDISGTEYQAYVAQRDDLETPHQCTAELEAPDAGAELSELETHATEFHAMLEQMFETLPTETRILEGTEVPVYIPVLPEAENEPSGTEPNPSHGHCSGDVDS